MTLRGSGRSNAEGSRSPLWLWPAVSGAGAFAAALVLRGWRPADGPLASLWPGDASSATAVLQALLAGVVTATTMTFSLTVVALQLASQQFSPRLLRQFTRDPVTKRVLSVLTGTFVYASTVLAAVRSDRPLPEPALLLAHLLGLVSFGALVAFVAHIATAVRVDTMMKAVHTETDRAISAFYAEHGTATSGPDLDPRGPGRTVTAPTSGFVEQTDVQRLLGAAAERDGLVRVEVRAGDLVTRGAPLGTVWSRSPGAADADLEALAAALREAVRLGYERTLEQDAAFGFRQLEDIAVKAVSPAVNDPVTAVTAFGHLGDLLVRLTGRRLGGTVHADDTGVGRVLVPDRDLRYYLDLACGQARRYGRSEPTVLVGLLRMLRDVAASCRDDDQRAEVARAARLVRGELDEAVQPDDAAAVDDLLDRVELALAGRVVEAFDDRSGSTRSV
ncbi:DUF2254 domain-containing protein [Kineococcus sp. SYSU DK004]|uniref:DUF2254 domain-containing protein n=1 Tax=Kineococcus sp. SYSU DK004 TaxID=3383125 RepID=UPI003D7DBF25